MLHLRKKTVCIDNRLTNTKTIKMKRISIAISVVLFSTILSGCDKIRINYYICENDAKTYHENERCSALKSCRSSVVEIKDVRKRTACQKCVYVYDYSWIIYE